MLTYEKYMKLFLVSIMLTCGFSFFLPISVEAHPGRTASDGCHYCRTNCDKWGEVWGERHCHGGYVAPTSSYTAPKIDVCSIQGLYDQYQSRKAKGETMSNLSNKSWWKKCPKSVRKSVYNLIY